MTHLIRFLFATFVFLVVWASPGGPAIAGDWEDLCRTGKIRVFVDKVLMRSNGWVMTEDHVRQIAEAGFNVVCPRKGGEDMERVRRIAKCAQKYGIYYMPWMRGTLKAKKGPKLLWSNGVEQDICSPNSEELWEWMNHLIIDYARISSHIPSLIGVFLDFEIYASKKQGEAYPISYDDKILEQFAKANDLVLPKLKPGERSLWLTKRGLHEAFRDFQIMNWRARCLKLRHAVDSINPRFQFCVYPAPGTLFIQEAACPEWSTSIAPIILADACTYGRPSPFMAHAVALQTNQTFLKDRFNKVKKLGAPFLYLSGIDPSVRNADPEFSGRNAVMISGISDGYWVFYEGPEMGKDHEQYWHWFTKANYSIRKGDFGFWREPRQTPDVVLMGQ